jgi:hypothetical protein
VLLVLAAASRQAIAQPVDKEVIDPSELPPPTATVDAIAPPFGAPGEVAISGATTLGGGYTRYSGDQTSSVSLWFEPSVDVFVLPNVSLGASISLGYGDQHSYGADSSLVETTTTTLSAAIRVGYNVPIARVLSFWPRALVGYEWDRQNQTASDGSIEVTNPLGAATSTFEGAWGELLLPLTLHPSPHLFASFGPSTFASSPHRRAAAATASAPSSARGSRSAAGSVVNRRAIATSSSSRRRRDSARSTTS